MLEFFFWKLPVEIPEGITGVPWETSRGITGGIHGRLIGGTFEGI